MTDVTTAVLYDEIEKRIRKNNTKPPFMEAFYVNRLYFLMKFLT